jgi:hypothetical protein
MATLFVNGIPSAGNIFNLQALLPSPVLSASASKGNIILSWPASFPGFQLQSKAALAKTNWANDNDTVVVTNGMFQVVIPTSGAAVFYRLTR